MIVEVKVPTVGESITTGVLGVWAKKDGEYVKQGDPIFEIETDKVTSEVYAETAGTLKHLFPAGTTVNVGQIVASIDESGVAPADAPAAAPEAAKPAAKAAVAAAAPAAPANGSAKTSVADVPLSPGVRFQVEEKGLDPATIAGTGKGGRILKGDLLAAPAAAGKATVPAGGRTTRKAMSPLRRKIADRLVSAKTEAAILTTFNEVDMTNIMALRATYQDRFTKQHGIKLGFMSFFVRATLHALKSVPGINAQIDGDDIITNNFFDIGVAISTEKGLFVPVIRDADSLSLAGIETAISDYAKKAKAGKITLPDMEGGVFTITNGGVFGSLLSTPIINPPQSAILGMHTIQERPIAVQGRVEIRPMMYLALSYDHRLVDGREAVTFLVRIKEFVENPGMALLEL